MSLKYQQIADALEHKISEGIYPPATMLPTESELCLEYDVSRQTIRKALSCLEQAGLISRRQGSGSRVLSQSSAPGVPAEGHRTVAIITTYISDYIFPSILRGAEAQLAANDCSILLYATNNQVAVERRILQTLLALPSLDGLIVEGTKTALPNPNLFLYEQLRSKKVPIVFLNGYYTDFPDVCYVLDDNYGGGYQLVEYLVQKGHRQIAGIFKSDDLQGIQRYSGYIAALLKNQLPINDSHVYWYSTETKPNLDTEYPIQQMLRVIEGCSAVVCYNDEVANLLVRTLLRKGIQIPDAVAIVSFDNSHYSDSALLRITSLSHENTNTGELAARLLLKIMAGQRCESQVIPWKIIEKETS